MSEVNDWVARIRGAGLRATNPRLVVLEALAQRSHVSVEELVDIVKSYGKSVSLQSTYNVLTDLCHAGLVRSIELPHQPARYELDNGDNHHHAVCSNCAKIYDVSCAVGYTPCLTPAEDHGMQIKIADVFYRGVCVNCQECELDEVTS